MAPPPPAHPTLHDLARAGDVPALTAALARPGADVAARDHYSRTPLILAAWGGHAGAVSALLAAGAAPTAAAKGDQSALHFAAMRGDTEGHIEVAKALIDAGECMRARAWARGRSERGCRGFSPPRLTSPLSLSPFPLSLHPQEPAQTPGTKRGPHRSTLRLPAGTPRWAFT
jgi:hypothetical protein